MQGIISAVRRNSLAENAGIKAGEKLCAVRSSFDAELQAAVQHLFDPVVVRRFTLSYSFLCGLIPIVWKRYEVL